MADSQTIGYVPGAWDMFHSGHLNIIRLARAGCDRLVVGVVDDDVLTQVKGRAPMYPFIERMAVIESLKLVDDVIRDPSSDKTEAWQIVGFDVLFKGDDWKGTPKGDRLEAQMAAVGATVHYFPYTRHVSSTALRQQAQPRPAGGDGFRVLIVCVANRCRSVLGEYLLSRLAADAGLDWHVSSAGTQAIAGQEADPAAVAQLAAEGIDASGFRTRRLSRELCERADLILAVTDDIRDEVAAIAPAAGRRVFTLLPLANLLRGVASNPDLDGSVRGDEVLQRASRARTVVLPLRVDRDVPDPVGQRPERFEACAATLREAFVELLPNGQGG